jgi:hypothetical protein
VSPLNTLSVAPCVMRSKSAAVFAIGFSDTTCVHGVARAPRARGDASARKMRGFR